MTIPQTDSLQRQRWWLLAVVLMIVCLAVRLTGLMALPIFGDEAITLRWAQLARRGELFLPLHNPAPFLAWLIAPFLTSSADPLKVARTLSVIAGMLSIPAVMALCTHLQRLARRDTGPSGQTFGLVAGLLFIFCPFLNFHQRLATPDALFLLESLLVLILGFKLILHIRNADGPGLLGKLPLRLILLLGLTFAITLLTYPVLPFILLLIILLPFFLIRPLMGPRQTPRFLAYLSLSLLLALLIGLPVLVHGGAPIGFSPSANIPGNLLTLFIPTGKAGQLDYKTGWLFVYLTPPVYLLSLLSLLWLAARKHYHLLLFLLAWFLLLTVPAIFFIATPPSHSALAAVPPLLIALAYAIVDLLEQLVLFAPSVMPASLAAVFFAATTLLLPIRDIATQATQWWKQPFVGRTDNRGDRYRYITGPQAGFGVAQAIAHLRHLAKDTRLVVVTDNLPGNPADALWVSLANTPNISLYYTNTWREKPILDLLAKDQYLLRSDKGLNSPAQPVTIPPGTLICFVTNHPAHVARGYFTQTPDPTFVPRNDYPANLLLSLAGNPIEDNNFVLFPQTPLLTPEQPGEQTLILYFGNFPDQPTQSHPAP